MSEHPDRHETSDGGDHVCWLERVCEECGALVPGELPVECWRCGAPVLPS